MQPAATAALVTVLLLAVVLTTFIFFQRRLAPFHIFTHKSISATHENTKFRSPGCFRGNNRMKQNRGFPNLDINRDLEKGIRADIDAAVRDRDVSRTVEAMKRELLFDAEKEKSDVQVLEVGDDGDTLGLLLESKGNGNGKVPVLPQPPKKARTSRTLASIR